MKKRNPAAVLLLPIVTLGIYVIYWLYATRKELIARTGDRYSIPPVSLLFAPLLLIVTMVIFLFALSDSNPADTTATLIALLVVITAVLAILILPLWWFWKYSQAVVSVVKGMDLAQMYVLYVVVAWAFGLMPVWMLLVQQELNKVHEHSTHPAHHQPTHPVQPA